MKTIIFYWSKGALTRIKIIKMIADFERHGKPCYLNVIAEQMGISRAALKKHLDILVKFSYVQILNPEGKPHFLALTAAGVEVLKEFSKKG
jgi:DNA-binding MarR family transcriptional regulator